MSQLVHYDWAKTEPWMDSVASRLTETGDLAYLAGLPRGLAAKLIADIIARHVPAPEPQPIRRGDVVQVDPAAWEGRVRPRLWIVLDIDEHGYAKTGGSPDVPLSRCVRIGRARYYPDGTKVED